VVEVGPEIAGGDAFPQVVMGGGDDAHVGLDQAAAAETVVFALGQHTEQARLQVERHVTDFVEKQGAAGGTLEVPGTALVGAGECAFFVAEQFRFQQVGRDGGGVDGDERTARAR
jgi:hypothetical protein